MTEPITDRLCAHCGLCCDGSLFDDVELSGDDEANSLEVIGLDIDTDESPLLLQPCRALRGTRCSIYQHRPECCRTFECRTLQKATRGELSIDEAAAIIKMTRRHVTRIKELCDSLGDSNTDFPLKERCVETLSLPTQCDDEAANRQRGELAKAMDTMAELVHKHFLG